MFCGYIADSGTGCLESVQGTMKSQGLLEQDVLPSIRKLGLSRRSPNTIMTENTGLF